MGIVKRQSFKAAVVNYTGTLLGIFTIFFLFPRILTQEQFGVTRLMVAMMAVLMQFPLFAMPNVIIKFYPEISKNRNDEGALLSFANFAVAIGLIAFSFLFFIFKEQVLHYFQAESNLLFVPYYGLVLPLVIFSALYANFETFCWTRLRISVPTFIKELFVRLLTVVVIGLYYFEWITFDVFMILFVSVYGISLIALVIYAAALKYPFHWNLNLTRHTVFKPIRQYVLYIYISVISMMVIAGMDQILVGSMVGLAGLSIYFMGFTIANMIQIPFRSIVQITYPIFAEAWQNKDLEKIKKLNKDSGLNIMFIGCFLFILLWANIHNIIFLLPEKYHVQELMYVILWVGLGKLFDMSTGLNEQIILTSPYYRITLILVLVQAVATILLNYFFIALYGVIGAAIATCLTLFLYNSSKFLFLWFQFRLQPYSWKGLIVLMIAVAVLGVNYFLPVIGSWIIDGVIRTAIVSILFLAPILYFRLSPDVNSFLKSVLRIGITYRR
jgi:O-antigen/teichoic acid export membrane protein